MNYNNKLNNSNSNSSIIKQKNVEKRNLVHFAKIKNDNSEENIESINNFNNGENNLNKSNINDIDKQICEEKEKKINVKDIKNEIVNNKIFEEKNELKKQSQSKNTQSEYEKNDNSKKELINIDNNREIGKEISLNFVFNNGKELYLDVKDSYTFDQIIEQLNAKYLWLKNINIKEYIINNESICINQTAKKNKLVNNSIINIIE